MHPARLSLSGVAATVLVLAPVEGGLVPAPPGRPAPAAAAVRASAAIPARPPAPAAARTWRAPLDGVLLRPFRVLQGRFAAGQHRGVDLAAAPGAPVRAACGGRVRFAGRVPGGGLTLSIRCGAVIATYQHLGATAVHRGDRVARGRHIATVGHARPRPHLHLGARIAATGAYVDPLTLLGRTPRGAPPVIPAAPVRVTAPARGPAPRPPFHARVPRLGPAPSAVRAPRLGPAPSRPPHAGLETSRAGFAGGFGSSSPRRSLPPTPSWPSAGGSSKGPEERTPADGGSTEPSFSPEPPWSVWLGLALVGLGLRIRGFLVRRRRARLGAPARAAIPASRATCPRPARR